MRLVNINYIDVDKYEYYLGRTVSSEGVVLLKQGVKLNENYVKQLNLKGIHYIYVIDEVSEGIEIKEVISPDKYFKMKDVVKDQFNKVKKNVNIGLNMNIINNTVDDILTMLTSNKDIYLSINEMRNMDDYLYEHSLNVAISCLYTGILLKYDKMKLHKLAVGALLHDVGKLFIDPKVLNKPSNLTIEERKEIEKHPELGYRFISDNYGNQIQPQSKQIILQHHEKWNGSGYPNQLSGERIYEMARICCICDAFDALTSKRVYRNPMPIYLASEYIYSLGNIEFDFEIAKLFLSKIVRFKEGSIVKLSDGSKGIVYSQNKSALDRPIIKLLVSKEGYSIGHKNIFIDLLEEKTLFIEKQLESTILD
ncbi:HD-GYP domain-containing protein [Alkalithermobacter paradoxus]